MKASARQRTRCAAFAAVLLCAWLGTALAADDAPGASTAVTPVHASIGQDIAARLQALTPSNISGRDVAEVLARAPAPRIVLLQGSLALVTMEPFAEFLVAMGYPEERLRNPQDGGHSWNSFADSRALAGMLAWYYETEGMRPMLIGHSQGGMLAIRVLLELAGGFAEAIPVWNPLTGKALPRTTIIDPLTGLARPVVGLSLPYAAAMATGKLPRLLLGQWAMLDKLRRIPDSADEFTGFAIEWDLIAGLFPRNDPYVATGSAHVRNVILPASYTHIGLPETAHLAANPITRAWIEAYTPDGIATVPEDAGVDTTNLVHAADIWYSVKRHWAIEAQRLVATQHEGAE